MYRRNDFASLAVARLESREDQDVTLKAPSTVV